MSIEEEYKEFKLDTERQQVKRARRTATMFGVLAIVALITFVYAFVQQTAAKKVAEIAIGMRHELSDCEKRTVATEEEAVKQQTLAKEALAQAERNLAEALRQEKLASKSKK